MVGSQRRSPIDPDEKVRHARKGAVCECPLIDDLMTSPHSCQRQRGVVADRRNGIHLTAFGLQLCQHCLLMLLTLLGQGH